MPVSAAQLDTIGARTTTLQACWVKHQSLVYDSNTGLTMEQCCRARSNVWGIAEVSSEGCASLGAWEEREPGRQLGWCMQGAALSLCADSKCAAPRKQSKARVC